MGLERGLVDGWCLSGRRWRRGRRRRRLFRAGIVFDGEGRRWPAVQRDWSSKADSLFARGRIMRKAPVKKSEGVEVGR